MNISEKKVKTKIYFNFLFFVRNRVREFRLHNSSIPTTNGPIADCTMPPYGAKAKEWDVEVGNVPVCGRVMCR